MVSGTTDNTPTFGSVKEILIHECLFESIVGTFVFFLRTVDSGDGNGQVSFAR